MSATRSTYVYVGTYTANLAHVVGKGQGIHVFKFDQTNGALEPVGVAGGVLNPSFLTVDPRGRYLYCVNETKETAGEPVGGVSAFAIDPATGELTFLNRQSSHGGDPCHITVDATGSVVVVANHENGSVAAYLIKPDGSLGPASDVVQHIGSSVDPVNQKGPHAHSVNIDRSNRFALVCDKGIDKVMVYRIDRKPGQLVPNSPPFVIARPGSAPRHLAFHPSGRYAFVINEIASTLTSYAFDGETGALAEIETVSTLPSDYLEKNSTADIRVHPNGKFVYGSNRGHNSIASFAIDEATGRLTILGYTSTQGATPRNFNLDPSGAFLLAANQNSDTIVAFAVDPKTGALTPTGAVSRVPTPVCIHFVER
ncbi:MAG TPA: lactonase family protein [Chloroflexota bacterium]|nr:lactonase family protein [Chloroflexota bacterium]